MLQPKYFYLLIVLSMVALFTAVFGLSSLFSTVQADPAAVMHHYAQDGASITTESGVAAPPNQLNIQGRAITRLGDDTRFRVKVLTMEPLTLTLDLGNGIVETFNLQPPGVTNIRRSHNYSNPGYYQVTAVAQNQGGVVVWTQTIRARVVSVVSTQDGGQIRHEWDNDPERIFLIDVEEDAVDEDYELHFNPVDDATFSNPFPDDENGLLTGLDTWGDDDLTPLNIPTFFDLEVHDPLGDNCLFLPIVIFLPIVQGDGSGSTAVSPCVTGASTAVDNFNEPVLLTFTYKDEDIPDDLDEEDIRFVYFNTQLNQWVDGVTTCPGGSDASYIRDPANNTIKLPICHQSRWSIGIR